MAPLVIVANNGVRPTILEKDPDAEELIFQNIHATIGVYLTPDDLSALDDANKMTYVFAAGFQMQAANPTFILRFSGALAKVRWSFVSMTAASADLKVIRNKLRPEHVR